MIKLKQTYKLYIALLLCSLQVAGIDMYAQNPVDSLAVDTITANVIGSVPLDSIPLDSLNATSLDSLLMEIPVHHIPDSLVADSIALVNKENLARLDSITTPGISLLSADSIVAAPEIPKKVWVPNPVKATWLAVVFPGAGQIYNRKYWKLPIVYGGFAGCAYALSWNNKMFKDYSQAYVDYMDDDPNTNSYLDFISDPSRYNNLDNLLKKRKDYYRRYRDISVFAFIGVYLLSIIDAYVDAELSNFDITPDLSMRVEPTVINNQRSNIFGNKGNAVGLQCSFTF